MYLQNTSSNAVSIRLQFGPFAAHRRQRIATDNIRKVQNIAASIDAHVNVVQANYEYETAIAYVTDLVCSDPCCI